MPEGPTIVILKEEAAPFVGRRVQQVAGNSKQDIQRMRGQRIAALRSWGKHFLIEFDDFTLRIHFMLFGSYRINEQRPAAPRLSLGFAGGEEFNFYSCSVKFIDEPLDQVYDWSADVMNDDWDPKAARAKLKLRPDELACDALLNQPVFSGVGNIIKNEVLHRIRVHPETSIGALPARKLSELIAQAREYSFDFYHWKKAYELKRHYQVHTRTHCPRDGARLSYRKHLGRFKRRAFFCEVCQKRY
ncbi:DNA-formamidopyrimidine glycosylase family protein [Lysobacter silvisoli]|uniref:Endonuclease n=1 Tax=Lysobacter silvisoli TaxID=2293254 RepID=A0A371K597_9GAMM|nr:DNA-formamidopyrimidine glycosylase family protein [Lysobacter silvisoli]RDZ29106.1 endonuclease [Lysobacter silvisoli]